MTPTIFLEGEENITYTHAPPDHKTYSLLDAYTQSVEHSHQKADHEYVYSNEFIQEEVNKIRERVASPTFTPCLVRGLVLPVRVGIEVMIDSGSSISVVKESFVKSMNEKARRKGMRESQIDQSAARHIVGIGNNKVSVLGEATINIELGPIQVPIVIA